MPAFQSSRAIVLRWRAYGESDKIATLVTEDFGKLTGIGKGARRSRRRFANSLEPLARVRVYFRARPGAELAFLESCELLASSLPFSDPSRFAYASYVAELVDRLTMEHEPVRGLYELLAEALEALERGPATAGFLRGYELQLLTRAGFEPLLDRCAHCGQPWAGDKPILLSTHHGTLSGADCRRDDDPTVPIDALLLPHLEALKALPLTRCRERALGAHAAGAAQFTGRLLALHLARPLRSLKLIEQLAS
ncbi:MAG: DNA repair protein RecO [Candidatus Binatia bacterium]